MREKESKEAHSFPSKDLTAALKEACLLFSSFPVARAWGRAKMKAKEVHSPMNAKQVSLTAILKYLSDAFPVNLDVFVSFLHQ